MAQLETAIATRVLFALNADVVGYSGLMADDFDATTEAMDAVRDLVAAEIDRCDGTLVNFVGDNFMAVFDSATDAVGAAIAISTALERSNDDVPRTRQIRFRMGIDAGPVTVVHGDYFGDSLNIAARIQALARPGGLSVSGAVFRELDEPALRFRTTGMRRLKNIPQPVEVFEFSDLPSGGFLANRPAPDRFASPSIAILPVHEVGLDEAAHRIPELIRADIIHRLADIPNLNVVDAPPEGPAPDPQAPHYLLETGLLEHSADSRFYANLIDMATMNIVSAHKWRGPPDDLADQSEQVADAIGRSIEIELIVGEPAREYHRLDDPTAIRRIYQGWYHLTSDTPDGIRRAIELFEKVDAAHPDIPIGSSLAALAHWNGAAEGLLPNPTEHFETARALAERAEAMGDPTGLAAMIIAAIFMSTGQAHDALERLEGVEITRPTCDVTYGLAASVRRYLGQWEQSIDLLDVAMRLTAINKPWYPTIRACSLYIGNRLESAASTAASVLEHQPRNLEALLVLAAAQVELGQLRRARATAELVRDRFPSVDVAAWMDQRPYQDANLIERWKTSLATAGLIDGS